MDEGKGKIGEEDTKIIYVLDAFHIIETMMGKEKVENFTVEEALKFMDDTTALLTGKMAPSKYKDVWKLK